MLFIDKPQTIVNDHIYFLTPAQLEDVKLVAEIKGISWEILATQPAQALKMVEELLLEDD